MAVRKTKSGLALKRWFKEDWKDVKTGKACGRKKGEVHRRWIKNNFTHPLHSDLKKYNSK